jgi:general stress protein 26
MNLAVDEIWECLQVGTDTWRTPVLATLDASSGADARTIVLREVDIARRELVFHTAADSGKYQQLARDPRCCLVIYDPDTEQQLRLYGDAARITDEDELEARWGQLSNTQQRVYGLDRDCPARQNFSAFSIVIHTMHQLLLAADGRNETKIFHWNENAAVESDSGNTEGAWSVMPARP